MKKLKSIEEAVLLYTSAWNAPRHEEILEKIQASLTIEATYTDRQTDTVSGHDAIADLIFITYQKAGPRIFRVLGLPDTHHQKGLFRWVAMPPAGYPLQGIDYFEFNENHRITHIVGFF